MNMHATKDVLCQKCCQKVFNLEDAPRKTLVVPFGDGKIFPCSHFVRADSDDGKPSSK